MEQQERADSLPLSGLNTELAENPENTEADTLPAEGGAADGAEQPAADAEADGPAEGDAARGSDGKIPPEILARARELAAQARVLECAVGADLTALMEADPAGKARVLGGEWDFADLWQASRSARMPAPVRSANGAVGGMDIGGMSEAQFARLNRMLREGAVVDVSR